MTGQRYRRLAAFCAALCLSGCASALPAGSRAAIAPAAPELATVYVFNDAKEPLIPLATSLLVLDGERIGGLGGQQYTWFLVRPGVHELSINDPSIPSRELAAARVSADAGGVYRLKYDPRLTHPDGAILVDSLLTAVSGKQLIDPQGLYPVGDIETRALTLKLKLVGNSVGDLR